MVDIQSLAPGMRIKLYSDPKDKFGLELSKKEEFLGGVYTVRCIEKSDKGWFARCEETRIQFYDFAWYANLIEFIIDSGEEAIFDTAPMYEFLLGL